MPPAKKEKDLKKKCGKEQNCQSIFPQSAPYEIHGIIYAIFDCLHRNIQSIGNFAIGKVVYPAKFINFKLARWQFLNNMVDMFQ